MIFCCYSFTGVYGKMASLRTLKWGYSISVDFCIMWLGFDLSGSDINMQVQILNITENKKNLLGLFG